MTLHHQGFRRCPECYFQAFLAGIPDTSSYGGGASLPCGLAPPQASLRSTLAGKHMKQQQPKRYQVLESLLSVREAGPSEVFASTTLAAERSRNVAPSALDVSAAPPSQLLSLVGQALKWQEHVGMLPPGGRCGVFRGVAPRLRQLVDKPAVTSAGKLRLSGAHAQSRGLHARRQPPGDGNQPGHCGGVGRHGAQTGQPPDVPDGRRGRRACQVLPLRHCQPPRGWQTWLPHSKATSTHIPNASLISCSPNDSLQTR